ncbi:MAG: hypothetical protein AAF694_07610 [Bacteroidota bacterium]
MKKLFFVIICSLMACTNDTVEPIDPFLGLWIQPNEVNALIVSKAKGGPENRVKLEYRGFRFGREFGELEGNRLYIPYYDTLGNWKESYGIIEGNQLHIKGYNREKPIELVYRNVAE